MFKKFKIKAVCFIVVTAIMTATLATAQSRSGEGVSRQVQSLKSMLESYRTAQEALNNAQDNQINALTTQINSMNSCANNSMVYAPSNPASDANGCFRPSSGSITQGRIQRPVEYRPYSGRVTFETPFAVVPTITYSITGYAGSGSCRGYNVDLRMSITNVTRRGFDYTMNGYDGGCGRLSIYGATWFASEDPVPVSGPLACAPTTHGGASFPSRTAGTTHSVDVGRTNLGCPSRSGYSSSYLGDTVRGTCTASGSTASWGSFSRTARCNYSRER